MIQDEIFKELKNPMSLSSLSHKLNLNREFLCGYLRSMQERNLVTMFVVGRSYVYQKVRD